MGLFRCSVVGVGVGLCGNRDLAEVRVPDILTYRIGASHRTPNTASGAVGLLFLIVHGVSIAL